jgi:glycerol-3-phosphate dehydrogenase (NAD(P)+)
MASITVLGAGMMGSALCVPLIDRGHDVRLVGTHLDDDIIASLRKDGTHPTLRYPLPKEIRPFTVDQLPEAMDGCELLALGVSSAGLRWAGEKIADFVSPGVPVFMITKGLEWAGDELVVLPEVLRSYFPESVRDVVWPAAIAGPCIAGELARKVPSCVVLAGRDQAALNRIRSAISVDGYYHVWTSRDVVGVEACAALKNAYAMGVAFGTGMHAKSGGEPGSIAMHNYESAVFAQAAYEMALIVEEMGGERASVLGLAGVGDLDVTNNGGRTGRFGRWLGMGLSRDEAIEKMAGATLECLEIIEVMRNASRAWREEGIELPLMDHMAEVVIDGKPVDVPFSDFFGA